MQNEEKFEAEKATSYRDGLRDLRSAHLWSLLIIYHEIGISGKKTSHWTKNEKNLYKFYYFQLRIHEK